MLEGALADITLVRFEVFFNEYLLAIIFDLQLYIAWLEVILLLACLLVMLVLNPRGNAHNLGARFEELLTDCE